MAADPKLDPPECIARLRELRGRVLREREERKAQAHTIPSIREFYHGKHVLVTGASGFVGRVIVEKLLRSCPGIGNIYILLRSRRGVHYQDRLATVLDVPMFDRIRREQPASLEKIVAIGGDCAELGLGLSTEERQRLVEDVSVIIHSAASVRFTDSVKEAVLLNTRGARETVNLARDMKNLKALVHISTAYCCTNHNPTMECIYPTDIDWSDAIRVAEHPDAGILDTLSSKFLGFQPNTYLFSKALSEQVMADAAKELPITIVRPSIVTCAINEPLPGWMDNLNGFAGFWAIVCKGVLRVHHAPNPLLKLDLVPVDVVSRATIVASWLQGTGIRLSDDVDVINIAISDVRPSSYYMMQTVLDENVGKKYVAYPGAVRYPKYWIITNRLLFEILNLFYHIMFGALLDTTLRLLNRKPMLMPIYRRLAYAMHSLSYFKTREFQFGTDNFWRLQCLTHKDDVDEFEIDLEKAGDWVDVSRFQLLGVMRYALKDIDADVSKAWAHANRLWWAEMCWYACLAFFGIWCLGLRYG